MTWKYYLSETTALYMIALKVGVVTKFCMLQSFSLHIVQIALVDKEEPLLNRTINQSFPESINCCHQARHCLPGDGCPSPVSDVRTASIFVVFNTNVDSKKKKNLLYKFLR